MLNVSLSPMDKARVGVVMALLAWSGAVWSQSPAHSVVRGTVYSYTNGGTRYYSARPPEKADAGSVRAIPYSYLQERSSATLPVFRCTLPNGARTYTSKPVGTCVIVSHYRPAAPAVPLGPTYRGYACTVDCSGHEAGYTWAEGRGIEHPDDCGGRSQSFIEGCQAYAEELNAQRIEDGECEDDDGDELCD